MSHLWTPAEDTLLRAYAEQGKSASEVMNALTLRTRSAVLGRADRIKVAFKGYGDGNKQNFTPAHIKQKREKRISFPKPDPQIPEIDDSHLPSISLAVAGPEHCRWVIGSPRFYRTCANLAVRDCSYCIDHARIVFADMKPVHSNAQVSG